MNTINDVADTLDIEIESLVLDAGYVSKDLLQTFHIGKLLGITIPAHVNLKTFSKSMNLKM